MAMHFLKAIFGRNDCGARRSVLWRAAVRSIEALETRVLLSVPGEVPSSSISQYQYVTGLIATTAVSPDPAQAGQVVAVTVADPSGNGNNGPVNVFCSDAVSATMGGASLTATGESTPGLYQWYVGGNIDITGGNLPQPIPDAGIVVTTPAGGGTVDFTINPLSPSEQQTPGQVDGNGVPTSYAGPWVVSSASDMFGTGYTAIPFDITGNPQDITVNVASSIPKSQPVVPGHRIDYTVNWIPAVPNPSSAQIVDQLPDGTTFIPHSANFNAQVVGNTIVWNNAPATVNFAVKVGSKADLAGLTSLVDSATVTANYSTGQLTGTGSATNTLGSGTAIEGHLHNADLVFPARLSLNKPLAGLTVLLKDSDGNVVDSTTTNGTGYFKLDPGQPGTYQLEMIDGVEEYDPTQNKIIPAPPASSLQPGSNPGQEIDALQNVTIPADQTKTQDLGRLYLPVGFASSAAKVLYALNNLYLPKDVLFHGAVAAPDMFQYNTSGAQLVLNSAENRNPPLSLKDLHAGGSPDVWVSSIRMMGSLALIDSRGSDILGLVDGVGRTVAFLASLAAVKSVSKNITGWLKTQNLPPAIAQMLDNNSINQKDVQLTRVVAFTLGVGQIVPQLLNAAGISSEQKQNFLNLFANGLRYGSDILGGTGRFVDDATFEVAINMTRAAVDAAVMTSLFGASIRPILPAPFSALGALVNAIESTAASLNVAGLQTLLNSTVADAQDANGYDTGTDTIRVLSELDRFDTEQQGRSANFQQGADIVNNIAHFLRGIDGIYGLNKALMSRNVVLGEVATSFQNVMGRAGPLLGELSSSLIYASLVSAYLGALDQGIHLADEVPAVPFGAASAQSSADFTRDFSMQPITASDSIQPVATSTRTARPGASLAAAASRTTSPNPYLADLNQIRKLISQNNVDGVNALLPTLESDDSTLYASGIVPLAEQAAAISSSLSKAQFTKVENFANTVQNAVGQALQLYQALAFWEIIGVSSRTLALSQVNETIKVVRQALAAEPAIQTALNGKTVAAIIDIDDSAIPTNVTAGQVSTFQVTVSNNGGQTSTAGTITLANDDGSLVAQNNAATQTLPPLAPGQSLTIMWQILAVNTTGTLPAASAFSITTDINGQLGTDLGQVLLG